MIPIFYKSTYPYPKQPWNHYAHIFQSFQKRCWQNLERAVSKSFKTRCSCWFPTVYDSSFWPQPKIWTTRFYLDIPDWALERFRSRPTNFNDGYHKFWLQKQKPILYLALQTIVTNHKSINHHQLPIVLFILIVNVGILNLLQYLDLVFSFAVCALPWDLWLI